MYVPEAIRSSKAFLFADDTKLVKSITGADSDSELLDDINALESWCTDWCLSLHPDKCVALRFVTVQSNLSWSLHYDNICSRAYQSLGFIRHL